ncbi:MAG TPA: hypothetical protein VFS44_09810 [Gemmatimonadaceae bacterium]|nr:hypothetical protein [Gemmatimonadaceae bacterium]
MSKEKLEKLAALGAFGVCAVLLAIWVLLIVITLPRRGAVGGGIDITEAVVTWVAVGLVVLALIAVHVVFARRLLAMARGERFVL